MKRRALFTVLLLVSSAACGPREGEPCDPVADGAICNGSEVLLCVCPAPDDEGACPDGDATWQVDELCSCTFNSMTCQ